MHITFDSTGSNVVFLSENTTESRKLDDFPGFLKTGNIRHCPKVLPVAYNLYLRCARAFSKLTLSPEFKGWVESPFKLATLPKDFEFITTPKDFQEIALRYVHTLGSAGILLDPGMGKTKVVLDYVALRQFPRSLIVCPVALLFVWEDEVAIHRHDLGIYVARSTDWEREWAGFLEAEEKAKAEGLKGTLFVVNYDKVVEFQYRLVEQGFDYIHIDEFLIKNPTTARTKALTKVGRTIPFRTGGSGTLINNSPLDSFSPIRFLHPSLVGWNYGSFMETYCVMKEMKGENGVKSRRPVAFRHQTEIKSILESCCIVMTKDKWLKLPDKHVHDVYVPMVEDQKEAYYSLMKNFHCNIQGRDVVIDNPLTMLSKLYQIAQGFIYYAPEDKGSVDPENQNVFDIMGIDKKAKKEKGSKAKLSNRETLFFSSSNKAAKLKELLEEKLVNNKVLIWYNLSAELTLIEKTLKEMGKEQGSGYLIVKGGDKDIGSKIRAFNKTQTISYLICQAKSVNYGVTVMGTKAEDLEKEGVEVLPGIDTAVYNEVFFSMNFSSEVYSQQQDRIHRLGQVNDCHYYRIFSMCPVESKIRRAIADKLTIREEMLVDIVETVLKEGNETAVLEEKADSISNL